MGGEFPLGEREPILAGPIWKSWNGMAGFLIIARQGWGNHNRHGIGREAAASEDAGRVDGAPKGKRCATRVRSIRGKRNIVLKARQMGLTTWAAARFFLKTITRPGTLTLEVAHTERRPKKYSESCIGSWIGCRKSYEGAIEDQGRIPAN